RRDDAAAAKSLRQRLEELELRKVLWFAVLLVPAGVVAAPLLLFMFYKTTTAEDRAFEHLSKMEFVEMFGVWVLDEVGIREDAAGRQLFMALPGGNRWGFLVLRVCARVFMVATRLELPHEVSLEPRSLMHPLGPAQRFMSSLAFFDDAVGDSEMEQLVIFGSGMSSLGLNDNYLKGRSIAVFEVNEKPAHHAKKALLKLAKLDEAKQIRLVSTKGPLTENFEWMNDLEAAGLDVEKRTLFVINRDQLWFWTSDFAEAFFDDVSDLMAENNGNRLAFQYVDEGKVESAGMLSRMLFGELMFGLPDEEQEYWVSNFGKLKPAMHERVEADGSGFMLCVSPRALSRMSSSLSDDS
ncbi:Uncharacterized protein SCF082_LOCUS11656, partial [Durusdinium trenchii]